MFGVRVTVYVTHSACALQRATGECVSRSSSSSPVNGLKSESSRGGAKHVKNERKANAARTKGNTKGETERTGKTLSSFSLAVRCLSVCLLKRKQEQRCLSAKDFLLGRLECGTCVGPCLRIGFFVAGWT